MLPYSLRIALAPLLCGSLAVLSAPPAAAAPLRAPAPLQEPDAEDELPARVAAAGDSVDELWKVVEWCKSVGRRSESRDVCSKIIAIDPDHADARKSLGHHRYDDQWFESYSALSAHKRAEDKRMLDEHGLVRFGDGWAKPDELPFLRMGWTKGDDGTWASARALEVRAQEARYLEDGWKQQADMVWVAPDETSNWDQGLWKCGDQWLDAAAADAYHANPTQPWTVPGTHFIASSTLPMEKVAWVNWYADQTAPELQRIFGVTPAERPVIEVLGSLAQYNQLAGANPGPEQDGLSSIHFSFFAESWFDASTTPREYKGRGVAYWDIASEALAGFGQFAIRHAAGQSWAEAIDPSWDTVSRWATAAPSATPAFWNEKKIPRWLRYGAASYVERFMLDKTVGEDGNPRWAREWGLENVRRAGGMRDLQQVFTFALGVGSPEQAASSARLIHEAGVIVMFILDGGNEEVSAAHRGFVSALKRGADTKDAVAALQAAVIENERALLRFADL